jgi:3-hydroxyacyl-CoA dehydrogenase
MTATGNPIGAEQAFDCGLVDRIVEGDLIPHAVGFAEEVRDIRPIAKSSERKDRMANVDPALFDQFR